MNREPYIAAAAANLDIPGVIRIDGVELAYDDDSSAVLAQIRLTSRGAPHEYIVYISELAEVPSWVENAEVNWPCTRLASAALAREGVALHLVAREFIARLVATVPGLREAIISCHNRQPYTPVLARAATTV